MKNITQLLGLGILVLAVGCSSTGLPRGAYVVGGGPHISYNPPGAGTCILVEKTSGKIVATKSSSGGSFEFDATSEQDSATLASLFGAAPTNAQFVLYFVPEHGK